MHSCKSSIQCSTVAMGGMAHSSDATYRAEVQATRVNAHILKSAAFTAEFRNGRLTMSNCVATHNSIGVMATSNGTINTLGDKVVIHNGIDSVFTYGSSSSYSKF